MAATPALAQEWPAKPLRMLVGSAPGGGTDAAARAVADKLGPALKTTVVVENKPGASNTLAPAEAVRANDGHSLVMGVSTAHAIAPYLIKLSYNNERDLVPVAYVGAVPNVLVVNKELGLNTVNDLVGLIRKQPGKVNFASSGAGSTQHIAGELFREAAHADITHVPYRGSAPALVDLMGGSIQMSFDTMSSVLPHIKAGKVKALAVASPRRSPQLPDVPTTAEAGLKDVEMSAWYGVYMPAATPKAVQDKVHGEVTRIVQMPDVKARLEAIGMEVQPMSQAQFQAFHNAENKRYAELIKRRDIRLD
ncbi:tripartite tricarboxylate transporter substrate binding protein [Azohydromonas sp. G-1-1-14]|uniref:Tripartite tricarboxylate transporter substrate binding protein n=2 Tax=Azohydromonas caseinilytica TaxID=2728836 RepID=A0A848FKF9_9BURK|nr:tripartite tricarboxylate transporter substrate binding protein [Azohydromonas caseinilytica]NML18281.1 tripartite tricarboxylate transporter substrate binding protein [Azohydromonas caseinilytica]